MEHTMRLAPEPFEQLRNGAKKIELRLYDEKRQKIKVGDKITFTNLNDPGKTLLTLVIEIYRFPSFEELYKSLPLEELGYSPQDTATASPKDMEQYYTKEQQAQYGVVALRLELLPGPPV